MKSGNDRHKEVTPIAWYKPTQWARLREVSEDRAELEPTYLQWFDAASKQIQDMGRAGLRVQRVDVDVEELVEWCRERGVPVTASARAWFTAEKAREDW